MPRPLLLTLLGTCLLTACHPSPLPSQPTPKSLHEVRDPQSNIIERDVIEENEPPPPNIAEDIPPRPYPTALYIRGYWYQDRPRHRWTWIHGYWR